MQPIEIPIEDLAEIDLLGENPLYRFEEILTDDSKNDLEMLLNGYLQLDVNADDIGDYEIHDDMVVLYVDDDQS
jgi:hypothetical protein